jgi:hypothetical protein
MPRKKLKAPDTIDYAAQMENEPDAAYKAFSVYLRSPDTNPLIICLRPAYAGREELIAQYAADYNWVARKQLTTQQQLESVHEDYISGIEELKDSAREKFADVGAMFNFSKEIIEDIAATYRDQYLGIYSVPPEIKVNVLTGYARAIRDMAQAYQIIQDVQIKASELTPLQKALLEAGNGE